MSRVLSCEMRLEICDPHSGILCVFYLMIAEPFVPASGVVVVRMEPFYCNGKKCFTLFCVLVEFD